ncbi:NAD-binding protein [Mycena indigotica]|uniref:NAD-binding protein n=1 Tax=Mycena indigotica TaxID=2126181 RepID=A0A8H6TAC1_9AGAR|nr:NAD-binding protein [Mycena indigotica]KAF7312235.1 NAD-binding protein [Mycena indigotica]
MPDPLIAVTGCNGSVGKRVVLCALKHGYHVVGIDFSPRVPDDPTPEFTFIQADLTDFDATLKALSGCEAVLHLAALPQPGDYRVKVHNNNVVISWNILQAAAELGIKRIAQASSVNVLALVYSRAHSFRYFPLDEEHPTEPDEPYGLSKVICELQAQTIVRRHPDMRVASLRLHWSVEHARKHDHSSNAKHDLWGYVQEDSAAEAFILAVTHSTEAWTTAAEAFFIVAPQTFSTRDTMDLIREHYPDIPIKSGKTVSGRASFFDCDKAARLLGWVHD